MRLSRIARVTTCVLAVVWPATVRAQDIAQDPGANAAIHLGPVGVTPRLALRNVGIDSNVLNASGSPQRDFTATFAPGADLWLSIGRARLSSRTDIGWIYFRELADQRSFEVNQQERLDLVLARFVPHVAGGYLRTRQRPNLEIDARALRTTTSGDGGVLFRLGPKLSLDTAIAYRDFAYAEEQAIENIRLATALNHTEQEVTGTVRYSVTPLTTFVVLFTDEHDRFQYSPLRDSNSTRIAPGFEFKPFALISGKASVGYRKFDALNSSVPDYSGLVAAVDVTYTARDATRFAFAFNRDVEYSFELTSPYYVSNGGGITLTQAIGTSWDLIGRVTRTTLSYQAVAGLAGEGLEIASRNDRVFTYGGGLGCRTAANLHFGVDADWTERSSLVAGRGYTGFRLGGSVTYGF
jgi:hypothetical protein